MKKRSEKDTKPLTWLWLYASGLFLLWQPLPFWASVQVCLRAAFWLSLIEVVWIFGGLGVAVGSAAKQVFANRRQT